MSHDSHRPARPADAEVPPGLTAHETGLTSRLQELIAAEDAHTRCQPPRARVAA